MRTQTRGFTLLELIVVIAILGVLLSIATFSGASLREEARDAKRINEIEQIGLAMRLYVQERGVPDCIGGTVLELGRGTLAGGCNDEADIISYLTNYFGEIPTDPLGPGNSDYYYYYDSSHICFQSSPDTGMVFAVNLESESSNASEVCPVVDGSDGGYLNTANINPSQPYVYIINRS